MHEIESEFLHALTVGLGFGFWIWMLVDLMSKISHSDQIKKPWLWGIFVVMTYVVGAFVYFIVVYYRSLSKKETTTL